MLYVVELGEVSLVLAVALENRGGLDTLDAILREVWGHLVED